MQIHSFGVQPLTPREGETGFTIVRAPRGAYLADTDGGGVSPEFLREVSAASRGAGGETGVDGGGDASAPAGDALAIARSGPYGRAAGVPTRVTRFLAVTAAPPRAREEEPPAPPQQPRTRFPTLTRMYNYVRGRRTPPSPTSSSAAAAGPLALAAAERDASDPATPDRAGDSANRPDDDDDDAGVRAHPPAGLRRRRVFAAAAAAAPVPPSGSGPGARSPSHALRDAVERVARELGIDPSVGGGADDASNDSDDPPSDRSAWDDVDEAGAPTPEALRARVAFLAETMTSVLREFDARLQRAGGHATRMLGDGGKNPATLEEVDSLPTRTAGDADCARCCDGRTADGVDAQGPQCYVCLGEYERGETLRTLPCGHAFHAECVDKWLLETRGACPTCRAPIVDRLSKGAGRVGETSPIARASPRLALPSPEPRGFAAVPSEANPRVLLLPGPAVASH